MSSLTLHLPYSKSYYRIGGKQVRIADYADAMSGYWYTRAGEALVELKSRLSKDEFDDFWAGMSENATDREVALAAEARLGWEFPVTQ